MDIYLPAGCSDKDSYFDMPSVGDDEEIDEDDRCEVHEGYERSDRCPAPATMSVYEPYTPAAIEVRCCAEHGKGMLGDGYRRTR